MTQSTGRCAPATCSSSSAKSKRVCGTGGNRGRCGSCRITRLADGQHRPRRIGRTQASRSADISVPDSVGVDEGAGRTLVDHLELSHGLDEEHAVLASVVTKALCHTPSPSNRDYLTFYQQHEPFIRECADKTLAWLADQTPSVAAVFQPKILATLRARAVFENHEAADSVDQLFVDAINGGTTAPEGSPRRALAKQLFDAMQDAFKSKKSVKRQDMLKWVLAALKLQRENTIKNILTVRLQDKKKSARPGRRNLNRSLLTTISSTDTATA